VLADALVEADSEDPDLIIDCATLTGKSVDSHSFIHSFIHFGLVDSHSFNHLFLVLAGAARVAMGTEMQAVWSNKEGLGACVCIDLEFETHMQLVLPTCQYNASQQAGGCRSCHGRSRTRCGRCRSTRATASTSRAPSPTCATRARAAGQEIGWGITH
jgi:hypothetical protein